MNRQAVFYALMSAALFGVATPAAKWLLGSVSPILLAGLLYLGAGAGIAVLRRVWRSGGAERQEAPLTRADLPWLAGAVACGGIVGPVLLMLGLVRTDAGAASLLLTLEGAATAILAWVIFREHVDRRILTGMACLVAGTVVLAWAPDASFASLAGPLAIAAACVAWGIDNNLTRKVSLADPLAIVEIKGLVAGPVNIALGLLAGDAIPGAATLAGTAVVGFLGYGVSLALYVLALRDLGTARTGAYFSTAPFLGSIAAVIALAEPVTAQLVAAGLLMALGVWLHLTERHAHEHVHETMVHMHAHTHDAHHRHAHGPDDPPGEPHVHSHAHRPIRHSHPHTPDSHHRHGH